MKFYLKTFILKMFLIFFYIFSLSLILPPHNNEDAIYLKEKDIKPYAMYSIKKLNRYFFYNVKNEVVYLYDTIIPGIPEIIFSNDLKDEKKIILNFYNLNNIIKIDFQKKEIFCYNKIRIKFYKLGDLIFLFGEQDILSGLNPGTYTVIDKKIIK
ncbi:hypothetical protein OSSY52_20720 [Tepiditoga spiralis]|uniref:Uncharacterized protein n=1 Tax=Tepiditoga spiralis TaxID=2108365 RepID=A0A7G1G670_9BACT|nr:hypothetical protein [Tepiditoga spiralis]BBE31931.1 hypothetical protein OSSY52_20720 [Tepiditoga spiralis]